MKFRFEIRKISLFVNLRVEIRKISLFVKLRFEIRKIFLFVKLRFKIRKIFLFVLGRNKETNSLNLYPAYIYPQVSFIEKIKLIKFQNEEGEPVTTFLIQRFNGCELEYVRMGGWGVLTNVSWLLSFPLQPCLQHIKEGSELNQVPLEPTQR